MSTFFTFHSEVINLNRDQFFWVMLICISFFCLGAKVILRDFFKYIVMGVIVHIKKI